MYWSRLGVLTWSVLFCWLSFPCYWLLAKQFQQTSMDKEEESGSSLKHHHISEYSTIVSFHRHKLVSELVSRGQYNSCKKLSFPENVTKICCVYFIKDIVLKCPVGGSWCNTISPCNTNTPVFILQLSVRFPIRLVEKCL